MPLKDKAAHAAFCADYHQAHRAEILARQAGYRTSEGYRAALKRRKDRAYQKQVRWITEYKVTRGCARCPERHPGVLDFHHEGEGKEHNVSNMVGHTSLVKIQAEIAKCSVLCSNCHRKHHWDEKQKQTAPLKEPLPEGVS